MDIEEYKVNLHAMYGFANTIAMLPLEKMLEAANKANNTGWFLDPTLYREKGKALREDIEMMEKCLAVKKLMQKGE